MLPRFINSSLFYVVSVVYPVVRSLHATRHKQEDQSLWLFYWYLYFACSWVLYLFDPLFAWIFSVFNQDIYNEVQVLAVLLMVHPRFLYIRNLQHSYERHTASILERLETTPAAQTALKLLGPPVQRLVDITQQYIDLIQTKYTHMREHNPTVEWFHDTCMAPAKPNLTFATSNFKYLYAVTKAHPPTFRHHVFNALYSFLKEVVRARNLPDETADKFLEKLQDDVSENYWRDAIKKAQEKTPRESFSALVGYVRKDMSATAAQIAVRLWTSAEKLPDSEEEFCNLLNETLRKDKMGLALEFAVILVAAMNSVIIARNCKMPSKWPTDNKVYRGAMIPERFVEWFQKMIGRLYRCPMLLATSFKKDTATEFLKRAISKENFVHVLFIFNIDPFLKTEQSMLIEEWTSCKDEQELLFTCYSAFTPKEVRNFEKGSTTCGARPVEIELDVAPDNKLADESAPLAEWH